MSAAIQLGPAERRATDGGAAARRAVVRWAWRLFRREWRQQLLVLALIVVAVTATFLGAAVATNTPASLNASFGTAQDLATFPGSDQHLAAQIAALRQRFGRVDVIENQTLAVPGSVRTYDLRAQDPSGPFGRPMLSLVSGRYPAGSSEVALTRGLASTLDLKVGDVWNQGGTIRRVVGIVENPQNLLDEFALVAPGRVAAPTQVTALFDAPGMLPSSIACEVLGVCASSSVGPNVQARLAGLPSKVFNPEIIAIAGMTLGMLLIALVSVGGFTVLAQRRLRSLGMLGALGATDGNIGLVVRANGLVVGVVGALVGTALGFVLWLAYRPHLELSAHHVIGVLALPWLVVVLAAVLAVAATWFAATRPARSIAKVPIVAALSGRPAPPRQIHRSALPGVAFLVIAFLLLGYSGGTNGGSGGGGMAEAVLGLVALIPGVILLAPFCLSALARLGRRTPIAVRLALRDLARYRARAGSSLAAISIGVLIAVIIAILAAARYGNTLDYVGPNLASSQLVVYVPTGPQGPDALAIPGKGGSFTPPTASQIAHMGTVARGMAASLGTSDVVQLEATNATLRHAAAGRNWCCGQIYVATPQLLRAFGIKASQVEPNADILTMRPGISTLSRMQLIYRFPPGFLGTGANPFLCPKGTCLANPVIQEVSALPSGTSAPNTVITEHAVAAFHLKPTISGWLIQTTGPITAAQINSARQTAAAAGMSIETRNNEPTSATVIDWATVFGIALALAILAMSVGLIRSETASDRRTLAATGAGGTTRRNLTAATAGALALTGALLGTAAGYLGVIGWLRSNTLNGGISALGNVPVANLLVILVGMPLIAMVGGWLLGGREPPAVARRPLE